MAETSRPSANASISAGCSAAETARADALRTLLETEGSLEELISALDDRLATADPEFDAAAYSVLLADVQRRLAIAKPDYA